MAETSQTTHERASSYELGFMGGLTMRECSCGATFTGSAEATFYERDRHIEEANAERCPTCSAVGSRRHSPTCPQVLAYLAGALTHNAERSSRIA